MEKEVLIQELYELEDEIKMFECFAKEGSCWENINPKAAKQDVEMLKYRYKVKTIDLSDEDRKELAQMAADKNIKLELLFESVFTEEEKEDYWEVQAFLNTPLSVDCPELDKLLDEEMKKKGIY